jgi:hypothetical protein
MDPDKQTEMVKAGAELGTEAIRATERLGAFVASIIGEPAAETIGILTDRLRFVRWRRLLRLADQCEEINRQRGLAGKTRIVPPKFALPMIEHASLEEDNDLQDLWANLIATAIDPSRPKLEMTFIEIVKQLDSADAKFLRVLHDHVIEAPQEAPLRAQDIISGIGIDYETYHILVDKLAMLGCLRSYDLSDPKQHTMSRGDPRLPCVTDVSEYEMLGLTNLGVALIKACMPRQESGMKREEG